MVLKKILGGSRREGGVNGRGGVKNQLLGRKKTVGWGGKQKVWRQCVPEKGRDVKLGGNRGPGVRTDGDRGGTVEARVMNELRGIVEGTTKKKNQEKKSSENSPTVST